MFVNFIFYNHPYRAFSLDTLFIFILHACQIFFLAFYFDFLSTYRFLFVSLYSPAISLATQHLSFLLITPDSFSITKRAADFCLGSTTRYNHRCQVEMIIVAGPGAM
jgi:hypothetical protein